MMVGQKMKESIVIPKCSSHSMALMTIAILVIIQKCQAVNWAQLSGPQRQNMVTVPQTPWKARWGLAATSISLTRDEEIMQSQNSSVYIIGGDNVHWLASKNYKEIESYPGGEGYTNDVWAATRIDYFSTLNLLEKTDWGDPYPRMVASVKWSQTNKGKVPPTGVSYTDWIACSLKDWMEVNNNTEGCEDATTPPGSYFGDNMFSPRRYHAAVSIDYNIFVMGGRAREMENLPDSFVLGVLGGSEQTEDLRRLRDRSVLKSDVWKSKNKGDTWKLLRPGCRFPQLDHVLVAGSKLAFCQKDSDCYGDEVCNIPRRFCVCKYWSPREQHAVAVHGKKIFLTGGYTFRQRQVCGTQSPGDSGSQFSFGCGGDYPYFLNDVWYSPDGAAWERLTDNGVWEGRSLHGLVSLGEKMYLMGGMTGDADSNLDVDVYYNDVWQSSDGKTWEKIMVSAPWKKRADFRVLTGNLTENTTEIVLIGGFDGDGLLEDVWTWSGLTSDPWYMDYGPQSTAHKYVYSKTQISVLADITDEEQSKLVNANLSTVGQLAQAKMDEIIPIRNGTHVCDYKLLAKKMLEKCSVKEILPDGYEYKNLQIVDGGLPIPPTQKELNQQLIDNWDGCENILEKAITLKGTLEWPPVRGVPQLDEVLDPIPQSKEKVCRFNPSPRKGFGAASFQGSIWVLGGYEGFHEYTNDVWIRDNKPPQTYIVTKPKSTTYDLYFEFGCDEPVCLYEYQVLDSTEMVMIRNWTLSIGVEDLLSWLPAGEHIISVRAYDTAGNVDPVLEDGRNVYKWVYVPKLPWTYIALGIVGCIILIVLLFLEWRRRRRKRAMERYAMKRMRRKFKAQQREGKGKGKGEKGEDWRKMYDDANKDGKKKKKKKKDGSKKSSKIAPESGGDSPKKKKKKDDTKKDK